MVEELERTIELQFATEAAVKYNAVTYKFEIDGEKGAYDNIVFCPNGAIVFIEWKRLSNKRSDHQVSFGKFLANYNIPCAVCTTVKQGLKVIGYWSTKKYRLLKNSSVHGD